MQHNAWTEGGRLPNPGKAFFLRLSAEAVADVNAKHDVDGLSYDRKAMIICGMELNTNGKWEESQLKPELQQIINKYRHFSNIQTSLELLYSSLNLIKNFEIPITSSAQI